jgi:hypothetical protein
LGKKNRKKGIKEFNLKKVKEKKNGSNYNNAGKVPCPLMAEARIP